MRNPALQLVGIAASPAVGAGGVRAEEEQLRNWLEQRLDALGIDPVAYSRFVLSLLRHPDDSALSPPPSSTFTAYQQQQQQYRQRANAAATAAFKPTSRLPARCSKLPLQGDREQRRAVVQCLTNAADQKCGVESLVDELCAKLRDLEGSDSKDDQEELKTATEAEAKVPYETLTPRDRALRYYAAFPALQPTTPKKPPHRKERVSSNNNNNNNNNYNYNNNNNNKKNNGLSNSNNKNNNNKARQKKNKVTITAESPKKDKEESGFAKPMERERDEEQELAMDQLKLEQLKAKFDQSLEALWDTGPGISQGTDSIWAAPSLSIPSGPLWPTDHGEISFPMITFEKGTVDTEYCYRETHIDDSPLIPWDVDLFSIEDCSDESGSKDKTQDATWKDSSSDGPWRWGGLNNITTLGQSPRSGSCYYPVVPVTAEKESSTQQKANIIAEPDEDLLTSARTHFRPIKEDGHYTDGTTFPVNNSLERVAYRRSESGNLFYLPGGESPYMEYREKSTWKEVVAPVAVTAVSANLTLKFRVRQCDKSIQTEPIRSPVKRRILSEKDRMYYLSNAAEEVSMNENEENEKDSFDLEQVGWDQSTMLSRSERKRRHSSNFKSRPLTVLRPLTL